MENEQEILQTLKDNQELLKKTYESAEKTRKYFLYSAIFTVVMFVLPLIGILLIIPQFLKTFEDMSDLMI